MLDDISYSAIINDQKCRFNYRVAALIERNERFLIHKFSAADFCFLPGGRVKIGETTSNALKRELQEELAISVNPDVLSFVVENFFAYKDEFFHEICFFFKIAGDNLDLPAHNEKREDTEYFWIEPAQAAAFNVQPEFLQTALPQIKPVTQHIVNIGNNLKLTI